MTLTNHMLAGSLLARLFPLPIALPLAFLSHFVLDALPHYGYRTFDERAKHIPTLFAVVIVDVIVAGLLVAWLISHGHFSWLLAGVVAFSPDLLWVYRFIFEEKFGRIKPNEGGRFVQFHAGLQKYEFRFGWLLEMGVAASLFAFVR